MAENMQESPSAPPPSADPQGSDPPPQQYPPVPQEYPPPQGVPPQQYPPPQGVPPQQYPPPQGMPPQQYPPPQGVPPQQYPPPQGMPPQQYPPPQGMLPPGQPYPMQAQHPPFGVIVGLNVMDSFRDKNEVQLVARTNGLPARIHNVDFFGNGDFTKECNFIVHVTGPDTLMLQSALNTGRWLAILNNKEVSAKGRGDANSSLKVHILPEGFIMLESVKMPGHFVNVSKNGRSKAPASVALNDPEGQFTIRVTKQNYSPSQCIMNGGRQSILNQLEDKMLVQLVGRATGQCMMIKGNGVFAGTGNTNDRQTFWILHNRGMGIVSLRSKPCEGYWIRYYKGRMVNQGGEKELSGDFRVLENPDGSVSFELANQAGNFITLNGDRNFTLFKVVLTGPAKKPTVSRTQLN